MNDFAAIDDGTIYPGGPPRPRFWHPWYRDKPWLLDWLESDNRTPHLVPLPTRLDVDYDETALTVTDTPTFLTLTKQRTAAFAPYVGQPFMYVWWVATDEYGRAIASDAHRHYRRTEEGMNV